jgi:amino acid adenylation domain-containing protein
MPDLSKQISDLSMDERELLELLLDEEGDEPDTFELSYSQRRLWFLDQLDPGSAAYNIPTAVRLRGALSVSTFGRSLNEIVQRHETLRTTFTTVQGQPVQVIAPSLVLPLAVEDLTGLSEGEREAEVMRLAAAGAQRPFDLTQGPLLRACVLRLGETEHVVLLTMHHIICDGWSMGVFIRELAAIYEAFVAGKPSPLPNLPIQYADYAEWQREHLQGGLAERQLSYWKQQLGGELPILQLQTDRPRPSVQTSRGARHYISLPPSLAEPLKRLSQREGATLYMILLAAFQTLLHRYTGQDDLTTGSSIAGRNRDETLGLIGFFLNTLVLRTDLSGNPSFRELLKRVREVALGAYANQDVPVEMLLEALQPNRQLSHNPLFQTLFILQNTPPLALRMADLTITPIEVDTCTAKFDLTLDLTETPEGLHGWLEYNSDLFEPETVARMAGHYQTLLEAVVADPEQRLSDLPLLTAVERETLLEACSTPPSRRVDDKCVHQLFEAQAERTPNAVAIIFEQESLTYVELNRRANQLAHHLRRLGVGPEVRVGICLERSIEMIVGLFSILKAGGAYVPLDPGYPQERLVFMMEDSGAQVLLTQELLQEKFAGSMAGVVRLDADRDAIDGESAENPNVEVLTDNLAYVIYTSGSTGTPKGVTIQHRSVASYTEVACNEYGLKPSDRVLQFASISFDASAEEIYPCLSRGATLVLRSDAMLGSASTFLQTCLEWNITVLDLPTAYWHELAARLSTEVGELPPDIRLVIIGGERALPERLLDWDRFIGDRVRLVNTYGPTEATIVATMCDLQGLVASAAVVGELPIGRAIPGAQAYVLDRAFNPVPVGVPGELYIGGSGLARDYLHRPELTAERFLPNPFSKELGARLYRTGDLVRYLPSGQMEFLGRADSQVKVRGFRIELGEIETALNSHTDVRECVVIAREDVPGDKRLVAYIVCTHDGVTTGELRGYLKQKLAEYMVPSAFVELERIPLTTSGKVDRRALPAPDASRPELEATFVAPRTETEEVLAGIWADVLGLERVGVNENFFELGGHSLLATQVISRVRELLHIELPLRAIFESLTLAELGERVEGFTRLARQTELPPIRPVPRGPAMPLSFSQERLWFLNQLTPDSVAYHVLRPMRIRGVLDVGLLERAFTEIVRRHEVYRTTFPAIDWRPVQLVHPPHPVTLSPVDISHLPEVEREAQVEKLIEEEGRRPFNLAQGPLWRLNLLRLGAEDHLLMLTEHHMVHDGWTEGRLVSEFLTLYSAFAEGQPSPLPELPVQYSDFAAWQRQCMKSDALELQLAYWKEKLSGALPLLELPTDRPRPAVETFRGATRSVAIPKELLTRLTELSHQNGSTVFMLLFAAFNILLHRYTGEEDILVGSPIAGRNRAELEPLIGFFVNTLVMRTDLSGDPTFGELLKRVREMALGAYANQDVPFERLVEEVQPERHLNRQALFQVMFVLHNAPSTTLDIPGLDVEAMRVHNETSKFDLLFALHEEAGGMDGIMEYSTDIFDASTIERMLSQFRMLLEGIAADPARRISDLRILTEAERHQVLVDWNRETSDYPHERSLAELFESQVERTPDQVAVIFEGRELTYRGLNSKANLLARRLRASGVGPDSIVAVCLERSPEMVVAVLGVLKAGGAYAALDPAYPRERLGFMLENAGVAAVLTQESLVELLPDQFVPLICLDSEWASIALGRDENLVVRATADNIAYVTYTSGSTGKPKGIAMRQRPLLNLIDWMNRHAQLPEGARTLQFASLNFDVSFQDIFSTLSSGGTLVIISEARRQDIFGLSKVLADQEVQRLFIPPVALQQLAEGFRAHELQLSLRNVIVAGEQLQVTPAIREMFAHLGGASLHNEYGPSETHVVTAFTLTGAPETWPQRPCIGRPLPNVQIYLLDHHLNPTPVGVPGELYIGGVCLARGYINRPDLTAERFVPHPFSSEPGARLYRTGDLARYLPDGRIEFLGRLDHQLKIRGFRVEPGEIEAVLGQRPDVLEALVLAREFAPGDVRLVAYVVPQVGAQLAAGAVRAQLREEMPEYMVPSALVVLDAMPLTPNGKVDRRALPLPNQERPELEQPFVAPRSPLEEVLTKTWADVLGLENIGVHDNFFELGGHSLLATQLVARLSEAFAADLPLRAIFEAPTVSAMAERMKQEERQPGDFERVAQVLQRLDEMTDADVQEMLYEGSFQP